MQIQPIYINTNNIRNHIQHLEPGQVVYLSGTIFTARDAAHKRICTMIQNGCALPFSLQDSLIYYAGPTPEHPDGTIGSFGPTTAKRMDAFAPILLDNGLCGMIGKGDRNDAVYDAIIRNQGVYFCAYGGLGALISKSITSCEEIAFADLGCESIKKLTVYNMPLLTAITPSGNSVFKDIK